MISSQLRIHWRFSTILKTSNESVWGNVFWYVKKCIFWKCIQYTIHLAKTQILKNFSSDKINDIKNVFFFVSRAPIHYSFTLISNSYMSWSTRFVSVKLYVRFSIFDYASFLLKFMFLFKKCLDSVTLKGKNSFQFKVIEKPHIVLLPDLWLLSCNKKF